MGNKRIWPIWLLTYLAIALPLRADDGVRVMSLNLCADPYLMGFAAPQQILALSPQSRDPAVSAFTAQAAAFPVSNGQIENIAALQPDLVVVSSYSDPLRNRLVTQLGIQVLVLDAANSYDAARREIIKLGEAIGRAEQARAYLAQLDAALAGVTTQRRARPSVLPLQRRNLTAGEGHIMDEVIALAGGRNIGRGQTDAPLGRISLEQALAARADYIFLSETANAPDSRGMEFLTHPALAGAYKTRQRLTLDNNLLVCAGASTPKAVGLLAAQLHN